MNKKKESSSQWYVKQTLVAFLLVLFAMPLAHAAMILMEKLMSEGSVHVAGFLLGLLGFVLVIIGVFARGDTRQTLWGLFALRCSARDRAWCGGDKTRISHPARHVWHVDDDDVDVCFQHAQRLFVYHLAAKGAVQRTKKPNCCAPDDAPHVHRYLYGSQHDAVGFLSAVDVLLRQKLLRRPSSRHVLGWVGLFGGLDFHAQTSVAPCRLGRQHPYGHRHEPFSAC